MPIPCCVYESVSHISHTFAVAITARLRKAHRFIVMETARPKAGEQIVFAVDNARAVLVVSMSSR
jgi:hypothetical protein